MEHHLAEAAIDWCFLNGLVVRPSAASDAAADAATTMTHAPFTLYPSPFPKDCFAQAVAIQPLFNLLVDRVSRDHAFLTETMDSLADVDPFIKKCYEIYKAVVAEGSTQVY